jgi:preprotein translocase subunit SecD
MKKALLLARVFAFAMAGPSLAENLAISKISSEPSVDTQSLSLTSGGVVRSFNVNKQPAVTEKDIAQASLVAVEGQGEQLEIKLNEGGRERFQVLTGESIGKEIAIVYNGSLVMAPRVLQEITGGGLLIILSDSFPKEEAQKLIDRVNKE